MKGQFIIQEPNHRKRIDFIKYILDKYPLQNRINSHYPIVLDFDKKELYLLESITCCACAAQNNQIISINHFKNIERK